MTTLTNLDFATGGIKPSKGNFGIEIPSFGDPRQQEFVFDANIPNPILKNTIPDFNPGPIPQVTDNWNIFDSPKLNLPNLNLPTFGNTNQIFESVLDNIKPFNPILPSNPTNGLSDFWNIFDLPQIDAPVITLPTFGGGTLTVGQKPILIKGIVVDTNNEPLGGASVVNTSSKKGVSTHWDNGSFEIEANPSDILEIQFLGFNTRRIVAQDIQKKVVLSNGGFSTDEVVIKTQLTNQPNTMVAKKGNTVLYGALGLAALFLLLKKPSKETKKTTKTTKGLASVTI